MSFGKTCVKTGLKHENIKILSRSEFSRLIRKNRKSKYSNVYYNNDNDMWQAQVYKDGIQYFGGRYHYEKDAALVADYLNYTIYGNCQKSNLGLTSDILIKLYNKLVEKYGNTTSERITITHQGIQQKHPSNTKTSKYVGVSKLKKATENHKKIWLAELRKHKKRVLSATYYTEKEAAVAYDIAAITHYGKDARTNFSKNNYKDIIQTLVNSRKIALPLIFFVGFQRFNDEDLVHEYINHVIERLFNRKGVNDELGWY